MNHTDFRIWKSVLETIDVMEDMNKHQKANKKDLLDFLETMQVRLEGRTDPLDHLDLFVLSRLCRVLGESLKSMP